jgi:alpha/beta hydrolase fold
MCPINRLSNVCGLAENRLKLIFCEHQSCFAGIVRWRYCSTPEIDWRINMRILTPIFLIAAVLASAAEAEIHPYPDTFKTQTITGNGAQIYVRIGGTGPAVVLLHGYGETGDMWEPLAEVLAKDHTVIVPDLRGMGLSGRPNDNYDKKLRATTLKAF